MRFFEEDNTQVTEAGLAKIHDELATLSSSRILLSYSGPHCQDS